MQIRNNNININKITLKAAQPRVAFKGLQADTVEISKKAPSANVSDNKITLNNIDSKRFSQEELNKLGSLYNKGEMELEPVLRFANTTKFSMDSMVELYNMKKDTKDEQFYDKVEKAVKSMGEDNKPVAFLQSIYTPKTLFSLSADKSNLETGIYKRNYNFDNNGEMIGKTEETFSTIDKDYREVYTQKSENFKTGEVHTKTIYDRTKLLKQTKLEKRDDNKNLLYTDEITPSKVDGALNYTRTYPDGRVEKMSDASYDEKTGITTIKRNLVSNDGTRTEYLYEDDPQGNRLIDYKITDKDGKVIMKNSQTFEKISDNKFISSNYNDTYEITVNDKELTVKDVRRDLEKKINFEICTYRKQEIIELLKQVPGQELFDAATSLNSIQGLSKYRTLESSYNYIHKRIKTSNDLYSFLHELGHAKDIYVDDKNNKITAIGSNKQVRQAYLEERKKFNENASPVEKKMIKYFIQAKGHYNGELGGFCEAVAEANALTSSRLSKEGAELAERNLIFQQHFPKTIAAVKDAMDLQNDIYAIEFYGT